MSKTRLPYRKPGVTNHVLQLRLKSLQRQGRLPGNERIIAADIGWSHNTVRDVMCSKAREETLDVFIVALGQRYGISVDALYGIESAKTNEGLPNCSKLGSYGYSDLGVLLDSFKLRRPEITEDVYDRSLPYDCLSDEAVLRLNDYHRNDADLQSALADAAREHRDEISAASRLAQRRVFILKTDWKNFLHSRGMYHQDASVRARISTLSRIRSLMEKSAYDRSGQGAFRLFVVGDEFMSASRFEPLLRRFQACALSCDRHPQVLCGIAPQRCWSSRRDDDISMFREFFNFMCQPRNHQEIRAHDIDRIIKVKSASCHD